MKECVSSIQEFLSYHVARNNYNYKTEHVYFISIKRIAMKKLKYLTKIIIQRNRSKQNYIQFHNENFTWCTLQIFIASL